jgi:hypothetical protein
MRLALSTEPAAAPQSDDQSAVAGGRWCIRTAVETAKAAVAQQQKARGVIKLLLRHGSMKEVQYQHWQFSIGEKQATRHCSCCYWAYCYCYCRYCSLLCYWAMTAAAGTVIE